MELTQPTIRSVGLFVTSLAFAALSIAALGAALLAFRFDINRAVRIHSLLVAISCGAVAWYLTYWRLIGIRTWVPW